MLRTHAARSARSLRCTARPFSLSSTCRSQDDKHSVNKAKKGDHHDIQTSNVKDGLDKAKQGAGGHATEGRDSAGGKAKAKKEFPEAPDPAIGMQDERGGRGG
ncbi:hypothetical protein OPT61_g7252 [Boeremia exigua]|uniref:Uncharacterized protein n=1 Tax=Boeremia exigua TaxID=749465 RepID=A0ACC2I310_9PLEO|nr:hypothetical protein OPT61_g7252 [Boeremia exigua]